MRTVDFPRTMVSIGGAVPVRLSVIDVAPPELPAERPTILFIHGAGGDAEQWMHQIAYFRRRYRVVAADLRGHGRSDAPHEASYALEAFIGDLEAVLRELRVAEPFVLVAHSFGGPVALTFAARHPKRVGRLILVATAPEIRLGRVRELLLRMPLPLEALERLRPTLAPQLHAPLFVLKRVLTGTLLPWRGWELLPLLHTPTLILGGQFDFLVPVATLQRMRAQIAGARFQLVRYARHLPQLERPDAVNRAIEGFIEQRRSWRGEAEYVAP
jgi:pimeloyl-ACP methyl ester carboxylesterase